MTDKKPDQLVPTTPQTGVVRNIVNQLKLIFRLMGDRRVSVFAKLIPVGAFAYLIFPFDGDLVLPVIGLVDDAMLLWLGSYVFTEVCPPEVVAEHVKALTGETAKSSTQNDIVDAEVSDVKEEPPQK